MIFSQADASGSMHGCLSKAHRDARVWWLVGYAVGMAGDVGRDGSKGDTDLTRTSGGNRKFVR